MAVVPVVEALALIPEIAESIGLVEGAVASAPSELSLASRLYGGFKTGLSTALGLDALKEYVADPIGSAAKTAGEYLVNTAEDLVFGKKKEKR